MNFEYKLNLVLPTYNRVEKILISIKTLIIKFLYVPYHFFLTILKIMQALVSDDK